MKEMSGRQGRCNRTSHTLPLVEVIEEEKETFLEDRATDVDFGLIHECGRQNARSALSRNERVTRQVRCASPGVRDLAMEGIATGFRLYGLHC